MKKSVKIVAAILILVLISENAKAQEQVSIPEKDKALSYYDRDKIDVSNLRHFYDGMLMADVMIHADAMFDAESKWKMTLYQMIRLGSNHYQLRSAYQLYLMGTPMNEVLGIWSPDHIESIKDKRLQAAFQYIKQITSYPSEVNGDTHGLLRTHFIDRQIAELMELAAINAENALHDNLLPIPTDQKMLDWGMKNLKMVGWKPKHNKSNSTNEQRANAFVGDLLKQAYTDVIANWHPEDLTAAAPEFQKDFVNLVTGYDVSPSLEDADGDGVEDPFDAAPNDPKSWKAPNQDKNKTSKGSTSKFNSAAYDFQYYKRPTAQKSEYPYSDRNKFDTEWTRQSSVGTAKMEDYFSGIDRATSMKFRWQFFFIYQLSAGCVHCQVHGSYGIYLKTQENFPNGKITEDEMPDVMKGIYALFDFERSDMFTEAEKSAFRFARDAAVIPNRTTAAHIEDLRRYYSDREIQEIIMTLLAGARLSTGMLSQITVTDRLSMTFALRHLTPNGWNPGQHIGWPKEQRRYYMSEAGQAAADFMQQGKVFDSASEWLDTHVPLAVDTDGDGVDDEFDGFPNNPEKWADTDKDGLEDNLDDDIDGDGLSNEEELIARTFPYKADSDGDGVDDATEIKNGTDSIDPHHF